MLPKPEAEPRQGRAPRKVRSSTSARYAPSRRQRCVTSRGRPTRANQIRPTLAMVKAAAAERGGRQSGVQDTVGHRAAACRASAAQLTPSGRSPLPDSPHSAGINATSATVSRPPPLTTIPSSTRSTSRSPSAQAYLRWSRVGPLSDCGTSDRPGRRDDVSAPRTADILRPRFGPDDRQPSIS